MHDSCQTIAPLNQNAKHTNDHRRAMAAISLNEIISFLT
jgi:hypothetical protein